ncbi:bacteriophage abortive infection AbiH family protein [Christensenellaceae bacterium NSJ-44]|uniref:Bacteriophage abortive infection AbiH family protein n=1 Tax=Luoshenia tenuis TaxID=2763654 RepID=A0A926CZE2_9FIRM|nr:bacteriophage abortive infection AbiH family protein [Luoshenia tenuis]MBC8528757.1 bacteriophage abortive infection AbiH family protein [Luoshenia tenuis]
MSSLFIIGNGFDIAHKIPTEYNNFRSFLIDMYPETLQSRDETVYWEDLKNIAPDEFAAEILLNAMDKACGENWCNFEEALAYINFNGKLPKANHKEGETDEEDNELMEKYLLYMDMLTSGFIYCSKIWQEFFRLWIKSIQLLIDDGKFTCKTTLKALFSQPDAQFFTFNYTKTLQKLYGIKKVIHVHNRVGQKLVFGHGEDNMMYGDFIDNTSESPLIHSSFLDDMIMSFKKDTDGPIKKYNDFFRKLNHTIDKVYSYGFSYGKVDSIYIKKIVDRISPDAIWYFTSYEVQNSEALRIKKIKLRRYGFKGTFDVYESL